MRRQAVCAIAAFLLIISSASSLSLSSSLNLLSLFPHPAYAHGLGSDESAPALIGNRQVSVGAAISPTSIEAVRDESARPVLTVRAHDSGSNATIAGIDYRIVVEHNNGNVLLDQRFSSHDGLVRLNLVPAQVQTAEVNGRPAGPGSPPVEVGGDRPAEVRSRIMLDGGLYHIAATIEKTSSGLPQLSSDSTFDLYVSISKTQEFTVKTSDGSQQQQTIISVKTYYADVEDFAYQNGTITFAMPFNWQKGYVAQVPLVHMEVQFPKAIKDLQVNGYRGIVNGKELPADAVLIDDYSYPDIRVVHFVLNNDRLTSLASSSAAAVTAGGNNDKMQFTLTAASKPKFPLDIMSTPTEKYLWELSWGPEVIETGVPITFVMNVQNPQTGELVRDSSFDFVLERAGGGETYRQHLSSGQGIFSYQYTFAQPGTYRLAAEKINGSGESAQLNIVVLQGSGSSNSSSGGGAQQQNQKPSGCLIATAAFGSELTPQVQFLRGFRDGYIMKSESGAAFMGAFNYVYYSFSPQVADYEREQPWLQSVVRTVLYPLFGILLASERAASVAGGDGGGGNSSSGEAGAVIAGATASALIGAVYLSPVATVVAVLAAKRNNTEKERHAHSRLLVVGLAAAVASLAVTAAALAMNTPPMPLLSISTSAFVVASAATAALAVARMAVSAAAAATAAKFR